MMLSGVRSWSSVGIAYCHGRGVAGGVGRFVARVERGPALRDVGIVGRAAAGRARSGPATAAAGGRGASAASAAAPAGRRELTLKLPPASL